MMVSTYGYRVFARGFLETCLRDCLFTTTFFYLSQELNPEKNFTKSVVIASSATALSSPINYLRSRIFFNFADYPVSYAKMWKEVTNEMASQLGFWPKVAYLLQNRLNIGFGTLRVGLGMAVAQKVYNYLKTKSYLNPVTKNKGDIE
jgi:hypothetical protein